MTTESPTHRICKTCNIDKPLEAFTPKKTGKLGRLAHCRECWNTKQRTPEAKAKRNARRRTPEFRAKRNAKLRETYTPTPEWEMKKHLPHHLYLIMFTQGNKTYLKPGLTRLTITKRYAGLRKRGKMSNLQTLKKLTFPNRELCRAAEKRIHEATIESQVNPTIAFAGSEGECRDINALSQLIDLFRSEKAKMVAHELTKPYLEKYHEIELQPDYRGDGRCRVASRV